MIQKIVNQTPLSMTQVKKELEKIKKRDKELNFRGNKTEEYLNHFIKKDSEKLIEKLTKLEIPRLKDEHIIKIVDLMPESEEELKNILSGYTVTVNKENQKKIVEAIKG